MVPTRFALVNGGAAGDEHSRGKAQRELPQHRQEWSRSKSYRTPAVPTV